METSGAVHVYNILKILPRDLVYVAFRTKQSQGKMISQVCNFVRAYSSYGQIFCFIFS